MRPLGNVVRKVKDTSGRIYFVDWYLFPPLTAIEVKKFCANINADQTWDNGYIKYEKAEVRYSKRRTLITRRWYHIHEND